MTTRETAFAPGTPCWVDLMTSDKEASKAFYTALFGWTYSQEEDEQFGGYGSFASDGYAVSGVMQSGADNPQPDVWTTYIATDDIEATVAAVTKAGGKILLAPMQVADYGSMAMALDSAGAAFGIWKAGKHIGFTKYNEPGSVTWDEHHSKDFASSVAFYEGIFGWTMEKTSDTDEFRYYQAQIDGQTVAGLMDSKAFLPPEVPSHWAVYFSVANADATIAKAVELGGSVIRPAEDTPFGRIADLSDATGAMFKIHQS